MSARIWILGASDPEMEAIETLLVECGERVAHAVDERGVRVRPATAYRGTCHRYVTDCGEAANPDERWYLVECDGPTPTGCRRVDHHRPGDPGHGRPPAGFLAASSIGQVIAELARLRRLPRTWERLGGDGRQRDAVGSYRYDGEPWGYSIAIEPETYHVRCAVPRHIVLTAAADHCLGAAYRGECPGVAPDTLMRSRAASRATFQGRSVEDVLDDIERAQAALAESPLVGLAPSMTACVCDYDAASYDDHYYSCPAATAAVLVHDMRTCARCDGRGGAIAADETHGHDPSGPCHAGPRGPISELPEAATRLGVGYIAGPLASPDGRSKITCSGTEEQVRAFLDAWAPAQGLVDLYGDPARGFAGGYIA